MSNVIKFYTKYASDRVSLVNMLFKLMTEFLYYLLLLIARLRFACSLTQWTTKFISMANCKKGKLTTAWNISSMTILQPFYTSLYRRKIKVLFLKAKPLVQHNA